MTSRLFDPSDSPLDLTVAALVAAVFLLSLAAAAVLLYLRIRTSRSRRLRRLGLNSLWPVRLLLVFFSCLWSLAELLRLPLTRRLLPFTDPALLCRVYVVASQAFSEPGFFATLLFLLRASTQPKPASPSAQVAFSAALAAALLAALPFLLLHVLFLFLSLSPWALGRLGIHPDVLGSASYADTSPNVAPPRCSYPLFGTVLLAGLGSVYVPLFVSACWGAVTVVINKRLRTRVYALAATVVVALSVQVAALALSALWAPGAAASQGLAVAAFLAVLSCVVAGEGVLVVQPVVDALALAEPQLGSGRGVEGRVTCGARAGDDCVGGRVDV